MEVVKIEASYFGLKRTKKEVELMAQEIGCKANDNIALYCHFVETLEQEQYIDFDMIDDLEFELGLLYSSEMLGQFTELLAELRSNDVVSNYLEK